MKQVKITPEEFWFPLDNAAKIFPATLSDELTAVFRLSVVLKNRIRIQPLLKAVLMAEKRFPYYKMRLKKGFFWYYLEHVDEHFHVLDDNDTPCRKFPENGLLMRILVSEKDLSVEFSHMLTDGTGSFEFLKTLLTLYAENLGADIPGDYEFYQPGEDILEEEYEDAYKRYFQENIPPMIKRSESFHIPWPIHSPPRYKVKKIIISLDSIKSKASNKSVSITDYLAAVYLYLLQQVYEETNRFSHFRKHKQIRLQVPVNLRNILPSKTMRNFSLFVMPEIDLRLGHYSFDEIIKTVHHQIRLETDEKLIQKNISRNVGSERKIYVKSIPLFLKSMILRMKYYSLGPGQYSGVVTNLGKVKFPPDIEKLIDHFVFIPPPPNKLLKVNCGVIGFDEKLVMSFGNTCRSDELETRFVQFLKNENIKIYEEMIY